MSVTRKSQIKRKPNTSNSHPRQINPTLILPPKCDATRKVISKSSHSRPNDLTHDVDKNKIKNAMHQNRIEHESKNYRIKSYP